MTLPAPTPLRVPPGTPGILLFGGTFDPPHAAHLQTAHAALRRAMPPGSWLVLVPAARSPLKRRAPAAGDRDRLAMLRAAFRPINRSTVWTDELDRARAGDGPSYWVDTLERLGPALPPDTAPTVRFLIGADQAADFHRWRRARDVVRLAEPLVVLRPPVGTALALRRAMEQAGFWFPTELDDWSRRIVRWRPRDLSATAVRARRAQWHQDVAPAVAAYIERRGLYR